MNTEGYAGSDAEESVDVSHDADEFDIVRYGGEEVYTKDLVVKKYALRSLTNSVVKKYTLRGLTNSTLLILEK